MISSDWQSQIFEEEEEEEEEKNGYLNLCPRGQNKTQIEVFLPFS